MSAAVDRRRRRHAARESDAGLTLIDLMVGMAVMSVVMGIFTSGIVDMYRTANRTGSAAEAQTRMLAAFNRLEREIRYAEHIRPPRVLPNGDFVVEYLVNDASNTRQCVRLALPASGGNLTHRQWVASGVPSAAPTTVADGVTRAGETTTVGGVTTQTVLDPFLLKAAGTGNSNFDRLEVRLSTTSGTSVSGVTRMFKLQYTALNTVSAKMATTLPTCAG